MPTNTCLEDFATTEFNKTWADSYIRVQKFSSVSETSRCYLKMGAESVPEMWENF
jgi:hypothetical protein